MVTIRSRFLMNASAPRTAQPDARLALPFERRQKSRQRATLDTGEEAAIDLPHGQVLRGGDRVLASDGRVIEIVAEAEDVVHVTCATPQALARAAYHLGNRHVPVQVGEEWLRIAADAVLERMLEGLDATLGSLEAAFEPEAGAYGAHHRHDNESGHGGRIHEFGRAIEPDHGHDHSRRASRESDRGDDHSHGASDAHSHDHE
jgi:urease accessory protein